ncbi:unnamed protein product, partial [marine sediment metagenome]
GTRVLSVGVESTSQYKLDSMAKKQKVEMIWEKTKMILKTSIRPYYTALLFTPHDRIEDLLADLHGFRKLSSMGVGLSIEPYLIPLPGTVFWEEKIPMSMRWVDIEGTKVRIKKGFAWPPIDKKVREIFDCFENWYPKYKKYRFDKDGVTHREKNYQSGIILDALEIVLRIWGHRFEGKFTGGEAKRIYYDVENRVSDYNVDIVGDLVKGKEDAFPH